MKSWFLLLIATVILFGTVAHAQSSNIQVDIVPPNPNPYENTNISLNSYLNNLDTVSISWSVNGKNVASGIGKKTISVTAPAAGAVSNIVAAINLPDGTINTQIILRSSVTVLLWQANDSYVPPFYRGKALPTLASSIKVVAMPEIRTATGMVKAENMTYAWKRNYDNEVDASGYGKSFFTFVGDYLENTDNVSVTASTLDQKYSGEASINIGTREPKLLFYKNDSVLGTIWENTLPDSFKIQESAIIEASPYFVSPKEIRSPILTWKWFINDTLVNLSGLQRNLMPLAVEKGVHGSSRLKVEIENRDKIFQTTTKEINVEF